MKKSALIFFCWIITCLVQVVGEEVKIFPDYQGITLPPNIAPLNFYITTPASEYRVKIHSASGSAIELGGKQPEVVIPPIQWKELLSANKGKALYLEIALKDGSGTWQTAQTLTNQIAAESLDGWLAYRLMRSIFNTYHDMGIYQRDLESFEEREILHNSRIDNGCLNCHGFQNNDPAEMTFHVRLPQLQHPLVRVVEDGPVEVIRKTFTYYSWNPQSPILAYTANAPSIFFHTWGENREVYDKAGEVSVLNLETRTVTPQKNLATENLYESWPSWDNKGEYLYFCRAPDLPQAKFSEIRFDLLRSRWDQTSEQFAAPEILFSGWTNRLSSAQPRVSPDGKFLVYTVFERGNFPIYQPSADLHLMDLQTLESHPMECNSARADTWHGWSSNGRWLVFSSKRIDGLLARPHFAYISQDGTAAKPFVLPQEDPHFYEYFIKTYNIPELIKGPVKISPQQLGKAIMDRNNVVKTKTSSGDESQEKELPPEEGYSSTGKKN